MGMKIAVLGRAQAVREKLITEIQSCLTAREAELWQCESLSAARNGLPVADAVLLILDDMLDAEAGRKLVSRYPHLPLIAVSGSGDFAMEAFTLNARSYLVRPPSREALLEALGRCRAAEATPFDGRCR